MALLLVLTLFGFSLRLGIVNACDAAAPLHSNLLTRSTLTRYHVRHTTPDVSPHT